MSQVKTYTRHMKLSMLQNALSVLRIKLNLSCLRINKITDVFLCFVFLMKKNITLLTVTVNIVTQVSLFAYCS